MTLGLSDCRASLVTKEQIGKKWLVKNIKIENISFSRAITADLVSRNRESLLHRMLAKKVGGKEQNQMIQKTLKSRTVM